MREPRVSWLTVERRQALQSIAATLAPLFILLGIGTESTWAQIGIIVAAVLQFLSSLSSLMHLEKGDWDASWELLRGAIYGLGATVVPALTVLGLVSSPVSDNIMIALSAGLGVLSNVVALFTSGAQKNMG